MKVAILDDWFDTLRSLPCFTKLDSFDVTVFNDHLSDTDALAKRLQDFDVLALFRERTAITAELLDQLPDLKLISQWSVYPHIDVPACTKNNVLLCSNLDKGGQPSFAAAEHTWGLMLAALRQIPQQMQSIQQGKWQMGVGKSIHGRTLGLYGYGRIAKSMARYAQAFGMNVIWWGSEEGRARAKRDGQQLADNREHFFSTPDVISLHVRLYDNTRGIITAEDLACMRSDALFINTARAGLIEQGALLKALNSGRPGGAALDVFDQEPITWKNDPLACHPNVIATPHIGFVTEDELEVQFADIFDQVVAFQQQKPIHMINPEVWTG